MAIFSILILALDRAFTSSGQTNADDSLLQKRTRLAVFVVLNMPGRQCLQLTTDY
jgi:hypothetical protein